MPGASRPWYCRFVIRASLLDYMLTRTTLLTFPADFSMRKLRRLLSEPLVQGCPPELSWHGPIDGSGEYQVAIETGKGAGWGLHGMAEAREHVRDTVDDHLEVIAAMEQLEQNWKDTKAFNTLHDRVVRANLSH